jgi:hypothetical protein
VQRAFGASVAVEGHEGADVEVGEHVAVQRHERLAGEPGGQRREADGAGGVERLALHGVVQAHAGARPSG